MYSGFAARHFNKHNLQLPREVFDVIYGKFSGHALYIHNLLNRLYSYDRDVDEELVAYVAQQIISEQSICMRTC